MIRLFFQDLLVLIKRLISDIIAVTWFDMKINWYRILLYFLHGLMYAKRGLFWVLGWIWLGLVRINDLYKKTIGFHIYKIVFHTRNILNKKFLFRRQTKAEFWGQRRVLQVFFFLLLFTITIPHSRLYSKEYDKLPGQDTLLYSLVGPGDQSYELEESGVDLYVPEEFSAADTWKEGSVSTQPTAGKDNLTLGPQELSGISSGGSAVTKPIIMLGVNVNELSQGVSSSLGGRSSIINYEVKPGDVIGKIAQDYGVNVNTILWVNDLSARSYIRPGDVLKILPTDGLIHKVASGDTVLKIARKYDASAEDIIKYNKLQEDGADIVIGEELLVPGGTKPQPVYSAPLVTSRPSSFSQIVAPAPSVTAPAGSGYLWPTTITYISQYYGWRHGALDLAGPVGSPIYATKSGTVLVSQCGWNWGYGCYVQLDHGDGVQSLYAHLSEMYVSPGDYVTQGQNIAASGNTGNSTGPHLHFEIQINGKKQNPLAHIRR